MRPVEWTVSRALPELNSDAELRTDEEPLVDVFARRDVPVERFYEPVPSTPILMTSPNVSSQPNNAL